MTDYWKYTRELFNKYNILMNKICTNINEETTDAEDEFLTNFALYLAHALLKDYGTGGTARDELRRVAKIIQATLEE